MVSPSFAGTCYHSFKRVSFDGFEFSGRTKRVLERMLGEMYITKIEDLQLKTEKELLKQDLFGKKALEEVKRFLAQRGMSLRDPSKNSDSIESLKFSNKYIDRRIKNFLWRKDINTIPQLKSKTESELLEYVGLGDLFLEEIKSALAQRGESLRDPSINSVGGE